MEQTTFKTDGIEGSMGTIASRWNKLDANRSSHLSRARQCAEITIPALLPPEGSTESQALYTPYQGLGSRGVNNLASKLLLALLPPNSPFFKMAVSDFTLEKLAQDKGARAEVEEALSKIERAVMTEIETEALRVAAFSALKYLVCIGNALIFLDPNGGMRVFRLDRYVVKRDPSGNVLEIIVKESVSAVMLPPEVIDMESKEGEDPRKVDLEKNYDLYTRIIRKGKKWEIVQEACGKTIPGSQGTYPLDESPWIPLRWTAIDGEDYGRGLVEEYLGDLRSLEALSQAIVEGSAAAAKVLFLVKPNGTTRIKTLAESRSGDIKTGDVNDVAVLQMDKFNDFKVASETISKIEQRLSQAFLLMSSIQRNAERVTAEEIRAMAGELEDALGGVYSVLSQEFQLPLVQCLMSRMSRQKSLPKLPKEIFKPLITTGLEALGRGHDLTKLDTFIQGLMPLGPETIGQYLNIGDYIKRRGTSLGIDMDGLIKSEEEVQQSQQQAQMMQMAQQATPGAINQLTKGVMDQQLQQGQGQQTDG